MSAASASTWTLKHFLTVRGAELLDRVGAYPLTRRSRMTFRLPNSSERNEAPLIFPGAFQMKALLVPVALSVSTALAGLSGLHIYWAFGGQGGRKGAIRSAMGSRLPAGTRWHVGGRLPAGGRGRTGARASCCRTPPRSAGGLPVGVRGVWLRRL